MEVKLTTEKEAVYEEVARTAEYTAAKMADGAAYELISITDENKDVLERFWSESKNMICDSLKRVLLAETEREGRYELTLGLPTAFDEALKESMERSLFSFFVMNITAKWYGFTNKGEAAGYAAEAATYAEDIMRKAYYKKAPKRPTYLPT